MEKSRSSTKGKGRMLTIQSSSEEDDGEENGDVGKTKTPSKLATTRRRPTVPSDTEGEVSASESRRGRGRPPKKLSRRSLSRGKDDEGQKSTLKTPRRHGVEVAVVVPTLKLARSLSRQRSDGYRSAVEEEKEKEVEPTKSVHESPVVAPKKRGRPRKSDRSVSRQRKEPAEEVASPKGKGKEKAEAVKGVESVPLSPVQLPKKRGRPRKSTEQAEIVRPAVHVPATQTDEAGDGVLSQETKIPKKRGRPRKSGDQAELVKRVEGEEDGMEGVEGEDGLVPASSKTGNVIVQVRDAKTPKKRGRPRKSAEQAIKPVEDEPEAEEERIAEDEGVPESMPPPKSASKEAPARTESRPHETPLRTYGRRSAATKATRKLHEEIMPDVVSFQRELKNGSVKAAVTEGPSTSGRRVSTEGDANGSAKKGAKKRSLGGDDEGGESEGEGPERKRLKSSVQKGRKSLGGDETVASPPKGRKKPESKARCVVESHVDWNDQR